jgi:transposase-like protein
MARLDFMGIEEKTSHFTRFFSAKSIFLIAPTIAAKAHSQKRNTNRSWRMDETYIKVKGKWVYLYQRLWESVSL